MIVVVDASVAAQWFLPESHSQQAALLLESDHALIAPDLMRLELGSALLKAVRRGMIDASDATEAMVRIAASPLTFEPLGELADAAFEIARQYGSTIYDGTYIALAQAHAAMLATGDGELARTARATSLTAWLLSEPAPAELGL